MRVTYSKASLTPSARMSIRSDRRGIFNTSGAETSLGPATSPDSHRQIVLEQARKQSRPCPACLIVGHQRRRFSGYPGPSIYILAIAIQRHQRCQGCRPCRQTSNQCCHAIVNISQIIANTDAHAWNPSQCLSPASGQDCPDPSRIEYLWDPAWRRSEPDLKEGPRDCLTRFVHCDIIRSWRLMSLPGHKVENLLDFDDVDESPHSSAVPSANQYPSTFASKDLLDLFADA